MYRITGILALTVLLLAVGYSRGSRKTAMIRINGFPDILKPVSRQVTSCNPATGPFASLDQAEGLTIMASGNWGSATIQKNIMFSDPATPYITNNGAETVSYSGGSAVFEFPAGDISIFAVASGLVDMGNHEGAFPLYFASKDTTVQQGGNNYRSSASVPGIQACDKTLCKNQ